MAHNPSTNMRQIPGGSSSCPHLAAALEGGERLGGAVCHNVTTDTVHVQLRADLQHGGGDFVGVRVLGNSFAHPLCADPNAHGCILQLTCLAHKEFSVPSLTLHGQPSQHRPTWEILTRKS